ncbi:HMG-box [Basidiobolus meristosporus CBS 931.73]|uniref:HMG-box n=1 Tax=Basidiobolus meristosporus CBS 931.73 TaxID=1314790 RepID=A0A1Y1Y9I4_9FUNG|nr:HMG-box [Basidiobolus meristosporus CBS 931.73]|eukprot:ORX94682.1 HMG-box [Basidiobolus meristosporus CBS 931.73]
MSKKHSAAAKKQHLLNTTPVEISLADATTLFENYSTAAICFSRMADVYKKVVDLEGSLIQKKAAKDPNAPKKPFTPYIQFCNEEREHIRKEFPSYTSQDVSRELGNAWKSLSETDKGTYLKKYESENAAYKVELEEYNKHKLALEAQENEDSSSEQSVEPEVKEDSSESEEDEEEDVKKPVEKKAAPQNGRKRKSPAEPQPKKPAAKSPQAETTSETTPSKKKKNKKKN